MTTIHHPSPCAFCDHHRSQIVSLQADLAALRLALNRPPDAAIALDRMETIAAECEQAMVRSQQTVSSSRARLERGYAKRRLQIR